MEQKSKKKFEITDIDTEPILFESKEEYLNMLNDMISKDVYTYEQIVDMQKNDNVDIEALTHYFCILFHNERDKNIVKPWPTPQVEARSQKIVDFRFGEKDFINKEGKKEPYKHIMPMVKKALKKDVINFDEKSLTNPEIVSKRYTILKLKKLINEIESPQNDFYKREQIKKVIPILDMVKQNALFNLPKVQITDKKIIGDNLKDKNDKNYDIEERFYMAKSNDGPIVFRLIIGRNKNGSTDLDDNAESESFIKISMFPRGEIKLQSDIVRVDYKPTGAHPNKIKPDGTFMDDLSEDLSASTFAHIHFFSYDHTMLFPKNKSPNIEEIEKATKNNFDDLIKVCLKNFNMPYLEKANQKDYLYNKDDSLSVCDVYGTTNPTNFDIKTKIGDERSY